MKKRSKWHVCLGICLVLMAVAVYSLQYLWFRNRSEDIVFYILQDVAFVPIQVLLVTLVLEQLLRIKEKQTMLNKLNMVIVECHDIVDGFSCHDIVDTHVFNVACN